MEERPRKKQAILFLIVLAGFTFLSLIKPDTYSSDRERRTLQQRPALTLSRIFSGEFQEEYEKYVTDQFPGRDSWVGAKILTEQALGKKDTNGVYLGKDGYLLEKWEESDFTSSLAVRNKKALSAFLKAWETRLGEGHVQALLVPGSASILKEKLPSGAVPFDEVSLLASWKEELPGLLDLPQVFAESEERDLYYRTDHHWTTPGAYEAYRAWAKEAGLSPVEPDSFSYETLTDSFRGTIYAKAGTFLTKPEKILAPIFPGEISVRYDEGEQTADSLYSRNKLTTNDPYAVFLDGNHAVSRIVRPEGEGTLLVIKDSFGNCFIPFAAQNYRQILAVDLRYFAGSLTDYIEQENVTDICVLYQLHGFVTERTVYRLGVDLPED